MRILQASLLASCGVLASCSCITVPASDSTPPFGSLTIVFQDPNTSGGQERSVVVSTASPSTNQSVTLPSGWPVQLFYVGSDDGGVQRLDLDDHFIEPPPETGVGSTSQPLWAAPSKPSGDFSDCAKTYRALDVDWTPWCCKWEFRLTVRDFHGNTATTGLLTLLQE